MTRLNHCHHQFSHLVMYDSLQPHGLQHTRIPCPSPTPGTCLNSCPSNLWCHPTISSSVACFCSWLQFFPASGSFLMSQFSSSGGQSIGASASASVLPMHIQDWFPLGLTSLISSLSKELSRVYSNTIDHCYHRYLLNQIRLVDHKSLATITGEGKRSCLNVGQENPLPYSI